MSQHSAYFNHTSGRKMLLEVTQLALAESANLIALQTERDIQFRVSAMTVKKQQSIQQVLSAQDHQVLIIHQSIQSKCSGSLLFMLQETSARQLLAHLCHDAGSIHELSELDEEALVEVSNILVNHCLSHYVQVLDVNISTAVPKLLHYLPAQPLPEALADLPESSLFSVELDINLGNLTQQAVMLWLGHFDQFDILHPAD